MPNFLCIDAGNTFVKSALYADDNAEKPLLFDVSESDLPNEHFIQNLFAHGKIRGAILCSVRESTDAIRALLQELRIKVLVLQSNTASPIINAYRSAETLGPDRFALAVGMAMRFPGSNCLAISAGTCITYNFVTANNAFRGGGISPGVNMRLRAMHHFTARLPQVTLPAQVSLLGYDTESSMSSGALIGAAAEIDGMLARYEAQFPGGFNAVLTGGDAELLLPHLKSRIFADPFLVMKGLHRILRHNAPYLFL